MATVKANAQSQVSRLRSLHARLVAWAKTKSFRTFFVVAALAILFVTTIFWSFLGAVVHQGNADQLVNAFLFEQGDTLSKAIMPSQHTFLLKWPLFWLIKTLGYTYIANVAVTVAVTLATVGAVTFVIYRILAKKPIAFGLVCLTMAAVLLPIAAQPYAGAILPVNMAMLTTRNLEYAVYIGALLLLVRLPKISPKLWQFWVATGLFGLLIASDKLFLTLSIGGAILTLVASALWRNRQFVIFAANWLAASAFGALAAFGILAVINKFVTHIAGDAGANPYGLVQNLHDFALGVAYGALSIFTNLGANPAFDANQLKQIPAYAATHLFSFGGLAFIANLGVVAVVVIAVKKILATHIVAKKQRKPFDATAGLAVALVATSLVAIAAFVATNHYYPVDARYQAILFFAAMISLAVYAREQTWLVQKVLPISGLLLAGIVSGLFAAAANYHSDMDATASLNNRNALVATAMGEHGGSNILMGDYWRVVPIRQASNSKVSILPLSSCTEPRGILTSTAWQPANDTQPFAYLLTYGSHSPDFPECSLSDIVAKYGKPNASTIISGSLDAPQETLLFYDHGVNSNPNNNKPTVPATVVPIDLQNYQSASCPGKTIITTVAHQDDDLLFMNPDQIHSLRAGDCLRTIYITAGDAGGNDLYWLGREKGSQEAHDWMDGPDKNIWLQRIIKLGDHQYITIATPRGKPNISLIYIRLPDGNVKGNGFKQDHFESLAKLESGHIPALNSVDGQSSYTKADLTNALVSLMEFYKPSEVRTQAVQSLSLRYPDHSDHLAVGRYTHIAYDQYKKQSGSEAPISYYVGYPIHDSQPNIFGQDYQDKASAFFIYSQYDDGGCTTFVTCNTRSVYGEYLKRQIKTSP